METNDWRWLDIVTKLVNFFLVFLVFLFFLFLFFLFLFFLFCSYYYFFFWRTPIFCCMGWLPSATS